MNKQQFLHMQKLAGLITESEYNKLIAESSLKDKIRELVHSSLGEAKKKKDEETDVAPQEEAPEDTIEPTDMDMGMDVPSDTEVDTGIDIDPKVKNIQNLLQKAYANAKSLGDEKLMTQIGNTITMVVRNQVLGGQGNVAESLEEMEEKTDLLSFVKQNQNEIANEVGAIRLENIMIDDRGDVGATGIYEMGEGGLAFRFPEDVDGNFEGEDGDEPRSINVNGVELMYIGYNI